jgi:membrane-bound metal-dependent hydrolase YbcI (DUF457 family)
LPFTPLHMGPGILVKSLLQGGFSLMVFGWSQIVMDIQPLLVMITGEGHLHGFSHTYIGATLIAIFSALSGKYLSELGLKILRIDHQGAAIVITWKITFISAFIGTYSHVLLDAIMHGDVEPYFPFSPRNELLGLISIEQLHLACVSCAAVGAALYYSIELIRKKRVDRA